VNTTVSGFACQDWSSQITQGLNYSGDPANFCRAYEGYYAPFCYTKNPEMRSVYTFSKVSVTAACFTSFPASLDFQSNNSSKIFSMSCRRYFFGGKIPIANKVTQ